MRFVNEAVLMVKLLLAEDDGWIGVDLDGTLARHTGWKGATKIGSPIPRMVRRVRYWVGHGRKVKIFTARADDERSVNAIKRWLKDNDLPDLEITNLKDKNCIEFWDDKAKAVEKNTGRLKESAQIIERTLRELQALPDNQLYLCHDQSVAQRHKLQVPFKCGCRLWVGGGVVRVEFYSQNEDYGTRFQVSDHADVKTLEPVPGETWQFDDPPNF